MNSFSTPSENILPEGFDGVFRLTNSSDEDFTAKWNSIEYSFPAKSTVPMIIAGESPENVQNIRMKFAREYAVREFYKSPKFAQMNSSEQGLKPALYTDSDLVDAIQSCLEPLPLAAPKARVVKENHEDVFHKDEDGKPRTKVLRAKGSGDGADDSLVGNGTVVA